MKMQITIHDFKPIEFSGEINSNKLLAHLHRLATGFAATGNDRLSNEMLTLIDQIERGEFNQGTKGNQHESI